MRRKLRLFILRLFISPPSTRASPPILQHSGSLGPFAHQTELMPALCFSIKLQMVPRSHLTLHTQKGAKINNLQPEGQQKAPFKPPSP